MLYNTKSNFLPLRSAGTAYSGGCVSVGFLLGNPSLSLSLFTDALWIGKGGYLQVVEQRVRLLCSLHTNILEMRAVFFTLHIFQECLVITQLHWWIWGMVSLSLCMFVEQILAGMDFYLMESINHQYFPVRRIIMADQLSCQGLVHEEIFWVCDRPTVDQNRMRG